MDKKKCWCYLTYVFSVDEVPTMPLPKVNGQIPAIPTEIPDSAAPAARGFEPSWFFNQKFPEDE